MEEMRKKQIKMDLVGRRTKIGCGMAKSAKKRPSLKVSRSDANEAFLKKKNALNGSAVPNLPCHPRH